MKMQPKARKSDLNLGVVAAIAVAALFMLVIGWFTISGRIGSASADPIADTAEPADDIPDITDIQGMQGSDMYIELTSKKDPDTVVGVLEAASFEPVGPNERSVEDPIAWFYLEDGRFAFVEAARGRFFMPTPSSPPESGVLQGAEGAPVRVMVFEKTPDGERPDVASMPPLLTVEFDQPVEFDMRHMRVSTIGEVIAWSPELRFEAKHLTAMFNEVRNRLELVEFREGRRIVYTPLSPEDRADLDRVRGVVRDEPKPEATAQRTPPANETPTQQPARTSTLVVASQDTPAASTQPATPPTETVAGAETDAGPAVQTDYYRAEFQDGVQVISGTNRMTADTIDLFVRILDNQLPEDAIAELKFAMEEDAADEPEATAAAAEPEPVRAAPAEDPVLAALGMDSDSPDAPAAEASDDTTEIATSATGEIASPVEFESDGRSIVLTWTGPLQILPLSDGEPGELARDDVYMHMTAERSGLVEFNDSESGFNGHAVSLDYGFTRGELVFSGPGGNVELAMPNAGELNASRMHANLATGDIHVRGPGVMRVDQATDDRATRQQIRWSEQADFAFDVVAGALTSDLTRASFAGEVEAVDGDAALEGAYIDATFVASSRGTRRLASLDVERGSADDGTGGSLEADAIRVDFAEGTLGHEIDPTRLVATGSVRGQQDGSAIAAQSVTATMDRGLDGDLALSHVLMEVGAEYRGADGTYASGERIDADAIGEVIRLTGSPARVGQNATGISGPEILVDGRNRRANVMGAGSFEHVMLNDLGEPSDVLATWNEGMSFDDYSGRVEAYGSASVVSRPDALTKDTVSAERVLIELSPFDGGGSFSEGDDANRRLVRATAFGSTNADGGASPANVESRVYAADDPSRVEQLFYLEGMQLVADNEQERLTVLSPGKMLILDRTESGATSPEPAGEGGVLAELANAGPGLTRFEWHGGMTMHRPTGTATMRRTVRVRHKNLRAGDFTELHCEKLTAQITERGDAADSAQPDAVKGELTQAEAAGAVYFKSGQRELIADRLLYDAIGGRAIATAAPGNLVSMFDATRGTPISSRTLSWDLVRDRIEIERLSPVVTPGNLP
ncbi:MAG: hypothetical protein RIB60_05535 [Phycisphaerales bacterium]